MIEIHKTELRVKSTLAIDWLRCFFYAIFISQEVTMSKRGENIRKRKDGRWEGRYLCQVDGVKKCRSVYGRSYGEVKQKLFEVRKKMCEDNCCDDRMTIHEISILWFAEVEKERKYSTYRKYRDIYEKHIKDQLGDLPVTEISSDRVCRILPRELSPSTQKSIYSVLRMILRYGEEKCGIPSVSLQPYTVVKPVKPVKILSQTEQRKLLECLYTDMDNDKLGVVICLSMGLRLGEICALKWEDIDFENQTLHVNRTVQRIRKDGELKKTVLMEGPPKTGCSKRAIPLPKHLTRLLTHVQEKEGYVINQVSPTDPRTYQYKFRSYLREDGIEETHFHILRHTFAINCISSGADVKSVSELLGHSNVNITMNKYVHPDMNVKRDCLDSLTTIYGQMMGQVS